MFGKKYLKLPKYYRGFRAVSVIFRCGGVLYFSLTFRYFFFRSSVIQRYFFYRHETKTTKDCADRRVSLISRYFFLPEIHFMKIMHAHDFHMSQLSRHYS